MDKQIKEFFANAKAKLNKRKRFTISDFEKFTKIIVQLEDEGDHIYIKTISGNTYIFYAKEIKKFGGIEEIVKHIITKDEQRELCLSLRENTMMPILKLEKIKQVIIVRKDLNMSKGRIAAQVAHASIKVFLDRQINSDNDNNILIKVTPEMKKWAEESFTKVVLGVNTVEELYKIINESDKAKIPFSIIIDNGFPQSHGGMTTTCIAIGPDNSEKIDKITGELELL